MKPKEKLQEFIKQYNEYCWTYPNSNRSFSNWMEYIINKTWLDLSKECGFATTAETRRVVQQIIRK